MIPQADSPCLQLSLLRSLDAGEHLALGRALRDLDDGSLLLIGSGFEVDWFFWTGPIVNL